MVVKMLETKESAFNLAGEITCLSSKSFISAPTAFAPSAVKEHRGVQLEHMA